MKGRQLLRLLIRGRVTRNRRLLQLRDKLSRRRHLQHAQLRRGIKHFKILDVRVQSKALELGQDPLGVFFVIGRADVVWPRAQMAHVLAQVVRIRDGAEFFFPLCFVCLAWGRRRGHLLCAGRLRKNTVK